MFHYAQAKNIISWYRHCAEQWTKQNNESCGSTKKTQTWIKDQDIETERSGFKFMMRTKTCSLVRLRCGWVLDGERNRDRERWLDWISLCMRLYEWDTVVECVRLLLRERERERERDGNGNKGKKSSSVGPEFWLGKIQRLIIPLSLSPEFETSSNNGQASTNAQQQQQQRWNGQAGGRPAPTSVLHRC